MTDNEERMLEELDTLQEEFKKIENPDINDMNRILDKIGQIDAEIARSCRFLTSETRWILTRCVNLELLDWITREQ